ncbi:MAG: DUF4301 family protein [Flavobacteriaceae bacterium]|nr:DUF4301 family protein [Flavobacteriaceae bacterium]
MILSKADILQIESHGISLEQIKQQILFFERGQRFAQLEKPAKVADGIVQFDHKEGVMYADYFDSHKSQFSMCKFIPASGAATRMFKFLNEFLLAFDAENQSINAYINYNKAKALQTFLVGMEKLPFFKKIDAYLRENNQDFDKLSKDQKNILFIKTMLYQEPFAYKNKPKALIPFHAYKNRLATPFEAHLEEAVSYATNHCMAHLHFTISEEHIQGFKTLSAARTPVVSKKTAVKFRIDYSFQKRKTDTITVDLQNNLFRDSQGALVFRPGGHGALIENLNDITEELIFIKNIDNIVVQSREEEVSFYKKMLAGYALSVQQHIFDWMKKLDENEIDEAALQTFLKKVLYIKLPDGFDAHKVTDRMQFYRNKLNRPLRICGMVRNEGEPGGGPFWVRSTFGDVSLQIVESAQVNLDDAHQEEILKSSTHFNPVDLVCAVYDYKGRKFDLRAFVDTEAVFISQKSHNGLPVRALELPGLWNGGMANWNTVFVEVPLITFNPVKTVNDLFKPAHQVL